MKEEAVEPERSKGKEGNGKEVEPRQRVTEVVTSQGSTYRYLPDGRTQRFKQATGELMEPMDVLVFIPPFEKIAERAKKAHPKVFAGIENNVQFGQLLLEDVQKGKKKSYVIDQDGKRINDNEAVANAKQAFLAIVDQQDPKESYYVPLSADPQMGFSTYDARIFVDKDGETKHVRHFGNTVVEIRREGAEPDDKVALEKITNGKDYGFQRFWSDTGKISKAMKLDTMSQGYIEKGARVARLMAGVLGTEFRDAGTGKIDRAKIKAVIGPEFFDERGGIDMKKLKDAARWCVETYITSNAKVRPGFPSDTPSNEVNAIVDALERALKK